tara:strand:- start:180 stop:587 length:408 start_codon:yes stop_codon:yes gene_type:complete
MAEINKYKLIAKIIIGFLALWALIVPILQVFGTTIVFPLRISDSGEIPYYRLLGVRTAVCFTFVYFAVRFLFIEYSKFYPIKFLDIFLKILFISNLLVWFAHGAEIGEYVLLIVFLPLLITTHIISGEKFRKYFG